ncbi:MAG: TonB-dependent receptor [Henriciella sp.]
MAPPVGAAQNTDDKYDFRIEGGTLGSVLDRLYEQTGIQLIYPYELAETTGIHRVMGLHTIDEALKIALRDTDFSGGLTSSGVIVISQNSPSEAQDTDETSTPNTTVEKSIVLGGPALATTADARDREVANEPVEVVEEPTIRVLDAVQVTATRRTESVQDVPIAINALSGDMIDDFGIEDGDDILKLFPNLSQKQTSSYNPGITIRGVGTQSIHISTQQSVGLYVDDITAVSPFVSQLSLFDLERVEVLRGPQNTLYGRNTTGGAINYITRKAEIGAGTNGYVRAEIGNGDRYGLEGAVGYDLGENAAIRIAANYEDFAGFFTNLVDGTDFGGTEAIGARMHFAWQPLENLRTNFTYSYAERDAFTNATVHLGNFDANGVINPDCTSGRTVGQAFGRSDCWINISASQYFNSPGLVAQTLGGDVVRVNAADTTRYLVNYTTADDGAIWNVPGSNTNTTSFENVSANIQYEFRFATLTSITSLLNTEIFALGTPDLHSFANPQSGNWETVSQELRLTSTADGPLQWLLGLYYVDETSDQDTWVIRTDARISPAVLIDAHYRGTSVYGQLDYDLTDQLTLTAGARYTEDKLEGVRYRTVQPGVTSIYNVADFGPDTRDLSRVTPSRPTQALSELAYKLGADYSVSEDVLLYASYSTGFKGGAFDNRALSVLGDQPISPEYIDAFELGLKSTLADGAIQLNAAVFHYNWEDQQLFEVIMGAPALVNVDQTEVFGAEIDMRWQASDKIYIQGGIGLLETEVVKNTNALLTNPNSQAQLGNELQFTPSFSANLLASYSIPVGQGELTVQPSLRHQGEYFLRLDNSAASLRDALTLIDLRLGYRFGSADQYEFAVRIENVTEEKVVSGDFAAPGADAGYNRGQFQRAIVASFGLDF